MSAPYVCPTCRRNVLRHAASLRALPRTPKATFISFTSKTPRQTSEQEKTDPPKTSAVEDGGAPAGQAHPERNPLESRSASSHRPSLHARSSSSSRSDALASLFDVLGRSNKYSGSPLIENDDDEGAPLAPQARHARASRPQPPPQKPAAKDLDDILNSQQKTSKDAWEYFQSHYTDPQCPALKSPSYIDIHKLANGKIFRKLMGSIIHDWCAGKFENALPDPIVIAERYVYLGIMRPEFWQDLLWLLNVEAFKKVNSAATEGPEKSLAEVTNQLMKLWDYLFKQSARPSDASHEGSQPTMESRPPPAMWSALPASKPLAYSQSKNLRRFSARLGLFLPEVPHNRISYSALVTYDLLTCEGVESRLNEDLLAQYKPFILFIAQLIPGSSLFNYSHDHSTANEMHSYLEASEVSAESITALFKRLTESQKKSMNIIGASGGGKKTEGEVGSSEESLNQFYRGRIERAYAQKKPRIVYELWELACQAMPRQKENPQAPEMPEGLYNSTLEALMGLKQPDQAIHVWNTMIQNGTRPTIKTWTAMLDGCGKARDIHGLEQIWVRMLNTGLEPDAYAWTARIFGILSAPGKAEHGLRVLEEMGKIWIEAYNHAQVAAKKKGRPVNEAELPAKPNTVVLNGAVTALSQTMTRTGRSRYLARVLAWGRSFGIMPDVITFNALISLSLRTGNAAEAMKLLQQMGEADVQPDVATFTIILSSIFRSASAAAMSQEEQNQKVMAVLKDLDARGIEANAHVYSTLIDGLLRRHNNAQAAKAVMNYMASKKIEISPHIYTILMTHYFEHEDFEAVEALWTQIQESETVVDIVFYDRMIERYAAVGDTNKMMTFLTRMSREGLTPGYPALQAVVVKLAEIGDWERFDEVVNDVKDGVGIAKRGLHKPNENVINQFWRAVERKQMQRPRLEDQLDLTQAR